MSEIFQNSCEKQFHILNTNFKIVVGHLRLGWTFEPRPIWPCRPFKPALHSCRSHESGGHLTLLQRNPTNNKSFK